MKSLPILVALLCLGACSNKAVYENIQINKRKTCIKLPPSEQDECMSDANKSYEDYKRERDQVLQRQ